MTPVPLERILYVEDDPSIQVVAKLSLEVLGKFELKLCNSGKEAFEELQGFHPDLILLDVMLPDLSGPEIFRKLRGDDAFREIPVIFVTAKAQPAELQEYCDLGAIAVISKPFYPSSFPEQLQGHWSEYWKKKQKDL